jgi:hypothetical protein
MYFESETKRFRDVIESTSNPNIVGFIHDRTDPDALGWVVLTHRLLRERFDRSFAAFYSKKIAFLMNRTIVKNFIPAGVLGRVEENRELAKEWLEKAALILIGDCSNPEIVAGLGRYLRSEEGADKPILFIDHHAKVENDLEDYPKVIPLRVESAQSTSSLMLHVMRNLGVELDGDDESQLRTAVVAKLGIEIDLIGIDEDKVAPSVRESIGYLEGVMGEKGDALIRKLRQIKVAQAWYVHLARAMQHLPHYSPNLAVCGLGVLDDNGILPFVANEMMRTGHFSSVMAFGIVYDQLGQRLIDIDLEASGRSRANPDIALPDLFAKVFFYTDEQGKRISRGGGRTNELLGDFAGAGASVPLKYWLDMKSFGVEKLKRLLVEHAWPIEFERIRSLLAANFEIKPDQILDVADRRPAEPGPEGGED